MAEDDIPRVAVVIPHLNQLDALQTCLAALANGTRQPDEVVVVDNGSGGLPPEDLWGLLPSAHLIREATPGPGPARNAGVAKTTADLLAFIDADCIADPAWIEALLSAHERYPDTILGGDVRIGPAVTDSPSACYEAVYAFQMERYQIEEGYTGAGNMAVPRSIWQAVGPFGGVTIAEDMDWGHRATAMGYAMRFVPDMRVFHPARPDLAALCDKWDRMIGHSHAQLAGSPLARLKWLAKMAALPFSPLAALPTLLLTDRLQTPGQRALAFAGLCAIRLHRARRMASLVFRPGVAKRLAEQWNRA